MGQAICFCLDQSVTKLNHLYMSTPSVSASRPMIHHYTRNEYFQDNFLRVSIIIDITVSLIRGFSEICQVTCGFQRTLSGDFHKFTVNLIPNVQLPQFSKRAI